MMKQKLPLHKQAELYLRNLIEQDEYKEGKMLPNEIELSEQLKMSRNTLRQAINTLVSEGLLIRKRGIGTQVAEKTLPVRQPTGSASQGDGAAGAGD